MEGVLVLCGPTASGKTDLGVDLALRFDAEIIGADSRQIYAGMPVGTAAPTAAQLRAVPHHLVGFLDPCERYSAAQFAQDAMRAIEGVRARGKRAIVVGGTGFYVRALCGDVRLAPQHDDALRGRLAREAQIHDPAFLYEWLRVRAPQRAAALYPQDSYRVLRALEVALAPPGALKRSQPLTSLRSRNIPYLKTVLDLNVEALLPAINRRVDAMLAAGLLEEAERIGADAIAADAVGYPQALAFLRGWSTRAELHASLVRATRRYAKRQMTWFRSEPDVLHIERADAPDALERLAREKLGWA